MSNNNDAVTTGNTTKGAAIVPAPATPLAPAKAIADSMASDASKATGTPAVATVAVAGKAVTRYTTIASKPAEKHVKDAQGAGIVCTNKRAATIALYLLLCDMAAVKPASCNASVIAMCSKLSCYFNGYSKIKGHALLGGEITARGTTGYASFVKEGYNNGRRAADVKKLLPNGELHARVQAQATIAKLVVAQYGKIEGIDTMLAACKGSKPVATK
jgi:hypothetical protein